ncbi:hypothetical protein LJC48_07730 [Desulfovibrio sp. OttesenSCG-928-C06]|nr:hypothetical protein [Desulfovibrio sp. OttesenSCG-928-C06]
MSIFEAIMLISFGAAWPLNIYKSWKTRSAIGKSVFFLYVISLGYFAGITHKLLYSRDLVLYLYIINLCMVMTDIVLYYRNRKLDREAGLLARAAG